MSSTFVSASEAGVVEWGVCGRPIPGEVVSGDMHLVTPFPGGVLSAVVDGLGHGTHAEIAAQAAIQELERRAGEPVADLVQRCHDELKRTRGAVLSIASIDAVHHSLTWMGVGNVEGRLFRADAAARPVSEALISRGGVVGYRLPAPHERSLDIEPGDTLIFATDGVRHGFGDEHPGSRPVGEVAAGIIEAYAKPTDDALVLVVRYLGSGR